MTFNEADKIVLIWGKYLEHASGKITMLFGEMNIPESFLPFPKDVLLQALGVMKKYYREAGNQRGVLLMEETAVLLDSYIDDEKAILQAAQNLNNPKWREMMIPAFKQFHRDWIKTQGDF